MDGIYLCIPELCFTIHHSPVINDDSSSLCCLSSFILFVHFSAASSFCIPSNGKVFTIIYAFHRLLLFFLFNNPLVRYTHNDFLQLKAIFPYFVRFVVMMKWIIIIIIIFQLLFKCRVNTLPNLDYLCVNILLQILFLSLYHSSRQLLILEYQWLFTITECHWPFFNHRVRKMH